MDNRVKYIVIVIFLIVLGAAGYFGYMYYSATGTKPTATPIANRGINESDIVANLKNVVAPTDGVDVTVSTTIPNVKVQFKNKAGLLSFLETIGFWKANGVFDPNAKVRTTIKTLDIIIADEATITKSPLIPGEVRFGTNKATLYLPIPSATVELKDDLTLSDFANKLLVISVYTLTKSSLVDEDIKAINILSKNVDTASGYVVATYAK